VAKGSEIPANCVVRVSGTDNRDLARLSVDRVMDGEMNGMQIARMTKTRVLGEIFGIDNKMRWDDADRSGGGEIGVGLGVIKAGFVWICSWRV
jgi:hypothetical protein